ncbi:MAG TPA: restriction endonuclease subunit S [Longimicrobium sp.]|jgi:type I restriction enzyme S subunit|uniref:restriction endonuclease subunit S n=1 Tax=Longimicrobium sp. TaxID=2029185 RepID=UPI002ED7FC50
MASRYVHEGVPFLRSQNVRRLRIDLTDVKFIPAEFHRQLSKSRLRPGDVVVVRTGEPGVCSVIPEELADANCADLVIIRPSSRIDARFLAYYINEAASHHVASHLVGAVQQHFNVGAARLLPIRLPNIAEQEAIVGILGSLDDKIEQNQRTGGAIEALARATFKAWFVDFEPVKAKAAGAASFPGMPHAAFAALPDTLIDSPLGPVPDGWEVRSIGDMVATRGGGTPSTADQSFWTGGTLHWATPKDLSSLQHPVLLSTQRQITDAGAAKISSGILPVDTVLLSSRAPVGYLALAKVPTAINQGFIAMTCTSSLKPHYLLHWVQANMEEIKSRASGTTFPEISKAAFRPIPVVVPPSVLINAFEDVAKPMFDWITQAMTESSSLAVMRDYLLPRLLSGRIRVTVS